MNEKVVLSIGGVRFDIRCDECDVRHEAEPAYDPFLGGEAERSEDLKIRVALKLGDFPDPSSWKKMIEAQGSWSLYNDGRDYMLAAQPSASGGPYWLARFDPDEPFVTVHCGKMFQFEAEGRQFVYNPVRYPLDQLLLNYFLGGREGVLLHAAGFEVNGKGLLFPGKSGAGKSTLSRVFSEATDAEILSDDRMLVRRRGGLLKTYGTPWAGEAGAACNREAELAAIFFIHHGAGVAIERLPVRDAFERLLPIASIPWFDKERMPKVLEFCEAITNQVPAYAFSFRPDKGAADAILHFMQSS